MEREKVEQIETMLREMLAAANQSQNGKQQTTSKPRNVRVIRRRKGAPDKQIV
jgi:hypothetical protein